MGAQVRALQPLLRASAAPLSESGVLPLSLSVSVAVSASIYVIVACVRACCYWVYARQTEVSESFLDRVPEMCCALAVDFAIFLTFLAGRKGHG